MIKLQRDYKNTMGVDYAIFLTLKYPIGLNGFGEIHNHSNVVFKNVRMNHKNGIGETK